MSSLLIVCAIEVGSKVNEYSSRIGKLPRAKKFLREYLNFSSQKKKEIYTPYKNSFCLFFCKYNFMHIFTVVNALFFIVIHKTVKILSLK